MTFDQHLEPIEILHSPATSLGTPVKQLVNSDVESANHMAASAAVQP